MSAWDGWSYPWASCLYSRGLLPNAALRMLRFYAEEFVAPNTFHTNSTYQRKTGLNTNTWRLMSVEGSFMYLSGVQEMLLQSYGGRIVIFPGVPDDWRGRNVAFDSLLAEGGFLVNARAASGQFACARIRGPRALPVRRARQLPQGLATARRTRQARTQTRSAMAGLSGGRGKMRCT